MRIIINISILCAISFFSIACESNKPTKPDLPKQSDRWLSTIRLDPDSKVKYIGKTRNYVVTDVSTVKEIDGVKSIRTGDNIEGIMIGAIKCSFHWRDASYGGKQYMWRGRWACMAGRSEYEVLNAVDDDGNKRFNYMHVSPITL